MVGQLLQRYHDDCVDLVALREIVEDGEQKGEGLACASGGGHDDVPVFEEARDHLHLNWSRSLVSKFSKPTYKFILNLILPEFDN